MLPNSSQQEIQKVIKKMDTSAFQAANQDNVSLKATSASSRLLQGYGRSYPESVQEMYINKMAAQLRTLRRNLEKRAQVQGGQATQAGDPPAGGTSQSQGSLDAAAQAAQGLPDLSRVPEGLGASLNLHNHMWACQCHHYCNPEHCLSSRLLRRYRSTCSKCGGDPADRLWTLFWRLAWRVAWRGSSPQAARAADEAAQGCPAQQPEGCSQARPPARCEGSRITVDCCCNCLLTGHAFNVYQVVICPITTEGYLAAA